MGILKKMITKYFFILILVTSNLLLIKTISEEEKAEKQKKLDACMNLSRARLTQDGRKFNEIFSILAPEGKKNDETERLMLFIILNCYKNVYDDQIPDLLDYDSIKALEEDYVKLLNLEKWFDLLKEKDKKKVDEEFMYLEESLKELQDDFGMYKEVRMPREKEY